ncbi:MAG: phosphoribosylaminoimidazolesuccinocarboxamide synthase [Bacteroidales bacterium]|nr:phosphoribosylaminoimidazolesuccinocarboxamide synthase [Bacteroidales bacterium]
MGKETALLKTDFAFDGMTSRYEGKVRDVYTLRDQWMVMVVTDRISAFDVILPKGIPYKGQVLNRIAVKFLDATADIVPNWKISSPHPNVTIGFKADPFKVEMVVRGYLTGHAWREYRSGKRTLCGIPLPEGMKEHQRFPEPILTPTTKAEIGHDEDISREEIIRSGLVPAEEYEELERLSLALFRRGTEMAAEKGLILVDTKYEFGKRNGKIILIDEIHTPDSSRYFYADGYESRLAKGEPQRQLSKEFVREWLIEKGFQGKAGQQIPEMTPDFVEEVSRRYLELYEQITGDPFEKGALDNLEDHIYRSVEEEVKKF